MTTGGAALQPVLLSRGEPAGRLRWLTGWALVASRSTLRGEIVLSESQLEKRVVRKVAAVLLTVVGILLLVGGLIRGLSHVFGTPDVPSISGGEASAIDCGTPFSPVTEESQADDPDGPQLTDYGLKNCQAAMGADTQFAVTATVFGGLMLAGAIGSLAAVPRRKGQTEFYSSSFGYQSGGDQPARGAISTAATAGETAARSPRASLSMRPFNGQMLCMAVVGSDTFVRMRDMAAVLGISEDSLDARLDKFAVTRRFDTTNFPAGRVDDPFLSAATAKKVAEALRPADAERFGALVDGASKIFTDP